MHLIQVLIQTPAHSRIGTALTYQSVQPLAPGTLVRVPLGKRETLGVVWDPDPSAAVPEGDKLRSVTAALDELPPLSADWRRLVAFAAAYYQRAAGEVALAALPPQLRDLSAQQLQRRLRKVAQPTAAAGAVMAAAPTLSAEQQAVMAQIRQTDGCFLLFGATGSGKTEVYLQCVQELLERQSDAQALVMVPEINLTPQLQARFQQRFGPLLGDDAVVSLHSAMTNPQRLRSWLAAHLGTARIVLGTRMAVFASMPALALIIVDEEHDPSYKQQEGARYSARDLAVFRGRQLGAKVILGSATPSLETWHHAQSGRYRLLTLAERVGQGALPKVHVLDMNLQPRPVPGEPTLALAPPLKAAIEARIARGEQSLLFLNRRGFAPVLHCTACGWKSGCPHCSAWRVFHKGDRTLRCHHCAFTERVPRACPECGNLDIQPVGRGTEKLEEQVAQALPGARVARIDADTTRLKGTLEDQLAAMHAGDVDVLVGTQMVTKGHDFRRVTLVAAVDPDGALFTADFRAPERLFATLMQAAGRAGRDAEASGRSEMWVQTWSPAHPLFAALQRHDFARFAASQLKEREMAGLPPFSHLALLRCEARDATVAEAFLRAAREEARHLAEDMGQAESISLYAPVPPHVAKVAGLERRQMLVESASRAALQRVLAAWVPGLAGLKAKHKGVVRWAIDVDPVSI